MRGENRSTLGENLLEQVENQQTQPTYDVRSGNRTRANRAPRPLVKNAFSLELDNNFNDNLPKIRLQIAVLAILMF